MFGPSRVLRTGRLVLRPVWGGDLEELVALKAEPRAFALLLGGVRNRQQATEELAADVVFWGQHGVGMWTVRDRGDELVGLTGIMGRRDGRGMALRFTLRPGRWGRGYASEAAGAALRYAHEHAGLRRVVAVARESNFGSREVLGAIGMRAVEHFVQHDHPMVMFESVAEVPDERPL